MISRSDLAAIFRRLADEIEKVAVQGSVLPILASKAATDSPLADHPIHSPAVDAPPAPEPLKPPPPPPPPSPPPSPVAPKPVIDLNTIKGIQQAFNQIRAANYPRLEENGVHDAVMTWALKEFQAATSIPVTGNIDEITINTIHKAIFGTART